MIVGAFCWTLLAGCGPHLTETSPELAHRHQRQADIEMLELREDIELFLLMEHPSRLSKWHVD